MNSSRPLFFRGERPPVESGDSDRSQGLEVVDHPEGGRAIGVAYRTGYIRLPEGMAILFRLIISGREETGLFLCVGSRFLSLAEAVN